jgi:hypothetical protein
MGGNEEGVRPDGRRTPALLKRSRCGSCLVLLLAELAAITRETLGLVGADRCGQTRVGPKSR